LSVYSRAVGFGTACKHGRVS